MQLLDERPDLAEGLRAAASGRAARRVPGHQLRPAPDAAADLPAGLGRHRGRRRHAVDLRVPRRAPASTSNASPTHFAPSRHARCRRRSASAQSSSQLANRIQAEVPGSLRQGAASPRRRRAHRIECFLAADDAEEAATDRRATSRRAAGRGATRACCAASAASSGAHRRRARRARRARRGRRRQRAARPARGRRPGGVARADGRPLGFGGAAAHPPRTALPHRPARPRRAGPPRARHARAAGDRTGRRLVLADALAAVDVVADLSDGRAIGCARSTRSGAGARAAAGRLPVLDLAETVILRTGLWQAAGRKGRENLLRFLDLAGRFAPIEGDPGLAGVRRVPAAARRVGGGRRRGPPVRRRRGAR